MALYEHVFVARQDVSGQFVDELSTKLGELIKENGGTVTKTESWGLRTLAYKIKKNRKGHYVLFNIDGPAPAIAELERNHRLSEDVIRFMTIRVDELEEEPSAMMRARASRDGRRGDRDRPRRGGFRDRDDNKGPRRPDNAAAPAVASNQKPAGEKPAGEKPSADKGEA